MNVLYRLYRQDPVLAGILFVVSAIHLLLLIFFAYDQHTVALTPVNKPRMTVQTVLLKPEEKTLPSKNKALAMSEKAKPLSEPKKKEKKPPKQKEKKLPKQKKKKPVEKKQPQKEKKQKEPSIQDRQKTRNLLEKAKENIAKIERTRDNSMRNPIVETNTQASAGEASYQSKLAQQLKRLLCLPEYGNVQISLTLSARGNVENIEVLNSESERNEKYIKATLPKLTFTRFGSASKLNETKTFTITLTNE